MIDVGPIQLVSASFGVAVADHCTEPAGSCRSRLVATEDLGRTWTDITPGPIPHGTLITSIFFLDPEHGWVVANDCVRARAILFRTADGARRWHERPIAGTGCHAGAVISPDFVDRANGWLIDEEPTGPGAFLSSSTDGGRTWTPRGIQPSVGDVRFDDGDRGWVAGLANGRGTLFRSQDAGKSWTVVALPSPFCCSAWRPSVGLPTFFDRLEGVEPVTWHHARHTVLTFDTTRDGGNTWSLTATEPVVGGTSGFPGNASVSVAGPLDWWAIAGTPSALIRTHDGGRSWQKSSLPDAAFFGSLHAIHGRSGWVIGSTGHSATLFATHDGGRSWHALDPVRRRLATSRDVATALRLPRSVTALTAGPDGVLYGAYAKQINGGEQQVVVRFDPSTGAEATSSTIQGGAAGDDRLAFAGRSLWAAGGDPFRTASSRVLYEMDPTTLAVRAKVAMPAPPVALASVPAGLWIAAGKHLVLLDPSTGTIRETVTFPGVVRNLVSDPDGGRLYVSTDAPVRHDTTPLLELDAWTGAAIARMWQGYADLNGVSGLAATDEGVWVTVPTGMMATLFFLRAGELEKTSTYEPGGSNGLRAFVVDGALWAVNLEGGYTCADPATGAVRGYVGISGTPTGVSHVVATPSGLFVGVGGGIDRIVPPPGCLAG